MQINTKTVAISTYKLVNKRQRGISMFFFCLLIMFPAMYTKAQNVALGAKTKASSVYGAYKSKKAVDGNYNDKSSRWLNKPDDKQPWIVIDFGKLRTIQAVGIILMPNITKRRLKCSWQVEDFRGGASQGILAAVKDNKQVRSLAKFPPVTTDQIRVRFIKNSPWGNINRIYEIEAWDAKQDLSSLPRVEKPFPVSTYPENANWHQPDAYSGPGGAAKQVVTIDKSTQLFVDNYLIADTRNIVRDLNKPKKYKGNPILIGDKPWENGKSILPSVLRINGEFKMWYVAQGNLYPSRSGKVPIKDNSLLCYATSKDGIHWTKPNIGRIKFRNSTDNNIVLRHEGSHFSGFSVLYRSNEEYPYKMLIYQGTWPYNKELIKAKGYKFAIKDHGHYPFQSKDGIHWEYIQKKPKPVWGFDRSNVSYDAKRGKYIGLWKSMYKGIRSRMYAESTDLVHWRALRWLLIPQWLDNPNSKVDPKGTHFYGHLIFNYGSLYLGILEILDTRDYRMHHQLMSSRDLVHWNRMSAPEAFIDHGVPGKDWDTGIFFMGSSPPAIFDGQLWFYYDGSTMDHGPGRRKDYERSIGLARLPVDRFVSIRPGDLSQVAALTTVPLKLNGKAIHINADATQGMVKLELLDANGNVIPGFSQKDCQGLLIKDSLDYTVGWKSPLPGKEVKIRFILRDAMLYSFWVE